MNSNTEKAQESESTEPEKTDSEIKNLSPSATTNDIPEFGWSGYAERINGRFAMIGLMAVLLVCLLYTSPSPRDKRQSRMPSSA